MKDRRAARKDLGVGRARAALPSTERCTPEWIVNRAFSERVQRTRKESNMAGPIYKLFMVRFNRSMYELSEEEQRALSDKVREALEQVGGKTVVMCASGWANEQWQYFGVEEFPDIEAVQKHTQLLHELSWPRYVESVSMLGTKWPPS
jgi:hypothetical protein